MKGHEEIERILASYRDAPAEERAVADAHLSTCRPCAARRAAFDEVDGVLARLPQPALPMSLSRPLPSLVANAARSPKVSGPSRAAPGFIYRGLAPAGLILFLVVALSVVLWSVNTVRVPATLTPTLTLTLTPTSITTRQTEAAGAGHLASALTFGTESGATPAPVPAPVARPVGLGPAQSPFLLAGYPTHAKITN